MAEPVDCWFRTNERHDHFLRNAQEQRTAKMLMQRSAVPKEAECQRPFQPLSPFAQAGYDRLMPMTSQYCGRDHIRDRLGCCEDLWETSHPRQTTTHNPLLLPGTYVTNGLPQSLRHEEVKDSHSGEHFLLKPSSCIDPFLMTAISRICPLLACD